MLRGGYRPKSKPSKHSSSSAPKRRWYGGGGGGALSSASEPDPVAEYSSEARQAPPSTDSSYVFPWNEKTNRFEVSPNFEKEKSGGRINEAMINALFKEIHSIRLLRPLMPEPLRWMAYITFILTGALFITYLFWGLFTNYYTYSIDEDEDKRFVDKTASKGRFAEIPIIAVAVLGIGIFLGIKLQVWAHDRDSNRIYCRASIINKILDKHKGTTFKSTNCFLECGKYASYIKIYGLYGRNYSKIGQAPVTANHPPAVNIAGHEVGNAAPAQQVQFDPILMPQNQPEKTETPKTPLITENPEQVRLQIPEEQPL